jgi:NAD(P)-dependent dehydrogenase (short-subunit alcohol dehydrogenase family)
VELLGQTALVTGGTAGIGLESARLLASEGAGVIVAGRDQVRGAQAVKLIGINARFVRADMSDADSVNLLVRQCGEVDILINSTVSPPPALTIDQGMAAFEAVFDTHVRTAYALVAGLAPGMLRRGRGSIVNITAAAAFQGISGTSGYGASTAALESLTRTWAVEFGAAGVRVNSVAPGPVRESACNRVDERVGEEVGRTLPLGRTAFASEIAEAVLFLSSPRSSYVTGSTLHVDGGAAAV